MQLKESGEDYLEAILELEQAKGVVKSVDIAAALGVSKPSVSKAMNSLRSAGYVNRETYGDVTLTDKGREKARQVLERHKVLSAFFETVLGVSKDTADKDACRAEHVLSNETMEKIILYMKR